MGHRLYFIWVCAGQFHVLISFLNDRILYYFIEAVKENSFCLKVFFFFLNFDSLREKKLWRKKLHVQMIKGFLGILRFVDSMHRLCD